MTTPDFESEEDQHREEASEMPTQFFLGEALKAFSIGRQLACERILGRSGSREKETAMVIVYVCTLDERDLEKTRTPDGIKTFHQEMYKWAEAKGITLRNHASREIVRVADLIWDQLDASDFDVKLRPDQKSKDVPIPNASGRGTARRTSPGSRQSSKAR
jgi:hypothetical protein